MKGNRWCLQLQETETLTQTGFKRKKEMYYLTHQETGSPGRAWGVDAVNQWFSLAIGHLRLSIRRPVFPCRQTLRAAGAGLRLPRQSQGEGPAPARDWEPFSAL